MKHVYGVLLLIFFAGCHYVKSPEMRICTRLDWQSVLAMFPKNAHQINGMKYRSIAMFDNMFESFEHTAAKDRNFHNTVRLYDNAQFKFMMNQQILSTLSMLSDDPLIQSYARHAVHDLQQYQVDHLVRNPLLLRAFQDYAQYGHDDPSKSSSVRSFLQKTINKLEHEGANLSPEKLLKLHQISTEISRLESQFSASILHCHASITLQKDELLGVPSLYLDSLECYEHNYKVPLTYEAFFMVLENCSVAATRKKFFLEFNNRVYPKNEELLKKLIHKRQEYARLVGYENFAEYECSMQMIGSAQRAQEFIEDMIEQTNKVVMQEFKNLTKELPASVALTASGKLEPWDEAFVRSAYRKKYFDIDTQELAQYFPINHVLMQLQKQFGQFFALSFNPVSSEGLWYKDVLCLQVRLLKTSEIIGYIVFDLYARPGKSEQAYQMSVIPTIEDDCNLACSGLSTIVTNFKQADQEHETLLEYHDVKTLLHEFGHALHELFGATEFVDNSGSNGPRDFLETPSQLFEMWMDNPVMIKLFSQHYKTKKPLSDAMINNIIAAEKLGKASLLQRQCLLSLISLEFGRAQSDTNPHEIVEKLYKKVRLDVEYCPQDHFETSFDHIIGYGSHYYGYVWSQVLAAGLFEYIEKYGITNSQVGQKLYSSLLAHGGSQDPQQLIELLLGTSITKQSLLNALQS